MTGEEKKTSAKACIPRHVAVIMDGNGRWAKARGWPRIKGHEEGAQSVRAIIRACRNAGVEYLTLYAFSVENWVRPPDEIDGLMKLLVRFLKEHLGRWLAPYAQRLSNQAQGTFYARLALLARDFVARDAQRLGVMPELAARSSAPGPEPEVSCPMPGGEADVPR